MTQRLTQRLLTGAAAAALVLTFATGCGGGDGGGRPSVDEISEGIQNEDMLGESVDSKVADCVAEAFHDSDLSDDALQAIADGDEDYDPSDEDEDALSSVSSSSVAECAGVEMPETESPDTE